MRELWRLAVWGLAAGGALTIAVYAGSTEIAHDRARLAMAQFYDIILASGTKPARPLDAQEGRRLTETVRVLAADRERLVARIATLEHGVDDITGSISRVEKTVQAIQQPSGFFAMGSVAPDVDFTSSIGVGGVPLPPAAQPDATEPTATQEQALPAKVIKRQFGLDLGSASSVEALRDAWSAAVRKHGSLLDGLHPIVHLRGRSRVGPVEMHLIAGPIANAATAARLCGAIAATGAVCQPALFEGQRLALR
jgi:hypothetical protein